mmetsp:Transcript_28400/g.68225  ORF Transcript_28400/g.68225 Transcript_28400/m.68225 type:complete len:276 (+) Transcript_28400:620-1447(+)
MLLRKMLLVFPRMHLAQWMRGICKWKLRRMALVFHIVLGIAPNQFVIRTAHRTASSRGARHVAPVLTTPRARLIARLHIAQLFAPKMRAHKKRGRRAVARSAQLDAQGPCATCFVMATCRVKVSAINRSALGIVGIQQVATSHSAAWCARKRKAAPRIMSCPLCHRHSQCRRASTLTKPVGLRTAGANVAQCVASPCKPARWFAALGRIMSARFRISLPPSSLARIGLDVISGWQRIGPSAVRCAVKEFRRGRYRATTRMKKSVWGLAPTTPRNA